MSKTPLYGTHVSIAGSLDQSFERASEVGCTTFQIFTRNPRGWAFKAIEDEEAKAFKSKKRTTGFGKLVDHMPYLPNLASSDRVMMKQSRVTLAAEVRRCDQLGLEYMVTHLGSHQGKGTMAGVRNIAGACNEALDQSDGKTVIALENMAGQKNCIGARFEDIARIIDLVQDKKRVGVCLDTCHLFAAGFDIRSQDGVDQTLDMFSDIVGMEKLKVVHLNDSLGALGENLDRHEHIGMGKIGKKGFLAVLGYKGVLEHPLILENPVDDNRGQKEDVAELGRMLKTVA